MHVEKWKAEEWNGNAVLSMVGMDEWNEVDLMKLFPAKFSEVLHIYWHQVCMAFWRYKRCDLTAGWFDPCVFVVGEFGFHG